MNADIYASTTSCCTLRLLNFYFLSLNYFYHVLLYCCVIVNVVYGLRTLNRDTVGVLRFVTLLSLLVTLLFLLCVRMCQFRPHTNREVEMRREYLKEFLPHKMNVEILCLFSREIDEVRRDRRFKAPFRPLRPKNNSAEDDDQILMNGAPPPAIRRCTRALKKARCLD